MLKYLTFIAPLLLKAPRKNPVQVIVLFAAMGLLLAIAGIAILIGIWQFVFFLFDGRSYLAWTVVGLLLLLAAGLIYFFLLKSPEKPRQKLPQTLSTDPIAEMLPDQLTQDPTVAKAMKQISSHPFGSVAVAVAAGALVGHELLGAAGRDQIEKVIIKK